jgi:hypothetical protein
MWFFEHFLRVIEAKKQVPVSGACESKTLHFVLALGNDPLNSAYLLEDENTMLSAAEQQLTKIVSDVLRSWIPLALQNKLHVAYEPIALAQPD